MKYGFRAPRPKKLYNLLYQYVFNMSIIHITIIGFISKQLLIMSINHINIVGVIIYVRKISICTKSYSL